MARGHAAHHLAPRGYEALPFFVPALVLSGVTGLCALWMPAAYAWLEGYLTIERFRQLIPEAVALRVERYPLPNLFSLNFVVCGLLGDGVAASTRSDPQAKSLGEYLRAKLVDIPTSVLGT